MHSFIDEDDCRRSQVAVWLFLLDSVGTKDNFVALSISYGAQSVLVRVSMMMVKCKFFNVPVTYARLSP